MGQQTLKERLKEWIGSIAWKVFLWSGDWTDDTYSTQKYFDEKNHREHLGLEL